MPSTHKTFKLTIISKYSKRKLILILIEFYSFQLNYLWHQQYLNTHYTMQLHYVNAFFPSIGDTLVVFDLEHGFYFYPGCPFVSQRAPYYFADRPYPPVCPVHLCTSALIVNVKCLVSILYSSLTKASNLNQSSL